MKRKMTLEKFNEWVTFFNGKEQISQVVANRQGLVFGKATKATALRQMKNAISL